MSASKECKKCGKCCFGIMGPIIFPSDLDSISTYFSISPSKFLSKYCERDLLQLQTKKVEIYYLKLKDKHCIFLNHLNLCEIYKFRPYQCKNAPFGFLAKYELWSHMQCIKKEEFLGLNTREADKKILEQLIYRGYTN